MPQFAPLLVETSHIAPCYEYRDRRDDETPEAYGLRVADELETEIRRLGPETVMAFVVEPVVGATMGAVPAVPGYLRRIREICDRHGVLMIADEVMCGMGRTGHLFACAEDGVAPDMITIAKGLGAGYQPIGALLTSGAIYDAIDAGSGFFQHGHTYMGHAMAAAGARAVLTAIHERGLLARVCAVGEVWIPPCARGFVQHPQSATSGVRGVQGGGNCRRPREQAVFDPARQLHAGQGTGAGGRAICLPMGARSTVQEGTTYAGAPSFIGRIRFERTGRKLAMRLGALAA